MNIITPKNRLFIGLRKNVYGRRTATTEEDREIHADDQLIYEETRNETATYTESKENEKEE